MRGEKIQRKDRGNSIGGYLLWIAGGLIIIIVLFFIFFLTPEKTTADFCPKSGPKGKVVLFLDVSDPLNSTQKENLVSELKSLNNTSEIRETPLVEKGEQLIVYFINEEGIDPDLSFRLCNPGDVNYKTKLEKLKNDLTEGEYYAKSKWYKFVGTTLNKINEKLLNGTQSDTSPIIESLLYIRNKEFPPSTLIDDGKNYKIII